MAAKSHSIARDGRIRKRRDYLACYANGKKRHSAHFVIFAYHVAGEPGRYGIAVSKKIGNAVARNRVKRCLREFFRIPEKVLPGWQIVAVAKQGASGLSLADICTELEFCPDYFEKTAF